MSILVTGGAGFIGSHTVEKLLRDRNETIVCLDNYNNYYDPRQKRANVKSFEKNPRVVMVENTFCDRALVKSLLEEHDVTEVVHLGGYAGVRYSVKNPWPYHTSNVEGLQVLLEAVRHRPVKRFLFASSSTVYGSGAATPFEEDGRLGVPTSPYGASKRTGELMGLTYHQLFGVPIVCIRLFSVYGPRLRPDLAMTIFAQSILNGTPLPLFGDGSIERDFTHISDVTDGILAALVAENIEGECINLGHNKPISIRHLIAHLENAFKKKANIEELPELAGDMPITYADISKAKRLLGYSPKVPFEVGIPEYVDWFINERAVFKD